MALDESESHFAEQFSGEFDSKPQTSDEIDNYSDEDLTNFLELLCMATAEERDAIVFYRNEVRDLLNQLLEEADCDTENAFTPSIMLRTMMVKLGKVDPRKPGDLHWFQG